MISFTPSPSNRSKHAFTLIELLVVIAIIAILAAILFPVFAQAKAAAKSSACLSNSKQLGLAMMQYTTDNDGTMPQGWFGDTPFQTYPPADGVNYKWMDAIFPYVKSEPIFTCPASDLGVASKYVYFQNLTQRSPAGDSSDPTTRRWGSYVGNLAYWGPNEPGTPPFSDQNSQLQTETSIGDTAGTVLALDGNGSYQLAWQDIQIQPNPTTTSPIKLGIDNGTNSHEGAVFFRHTNRANAIWCDGHAKSVAPGFITTKVTDTAQPTVGAYKYFTSELD